MSGAPAVRPAAPAAPAAAPAGMGSRPIVIVLVALLLSSASDVVTTLFEKRSVGDTVSLGGKTHVSFCTS